MGSKKDLESTFKGTAPAREPSSAATGSVAQRITVVEQRIGALEARFALVEGELRARKMLPPIASPGRSQTRPKLSPEARRAGQVARAEHARLMRAAMRSSRKAGKGRGR